jgi:hypothetical protein
MAENQDKVGSVARVVALAILAFFTLSLTVPGAMVYLTVVGDWADSPRGFYGIEGAVGWIFGVGAAVAIAAGLAVAGVILRLLRWRRAPLASLFLAVLGAGFIIATYLVFSDTSTSPESIEIVFLQVASLVLLVVVALPPFLHWAMAKPVTVPLPTEPAP